MFTSAGHIERFSSSRFCDTQYLDMNGVIHNCAAANKGENGEAPKPDVLYGAVMAYMDFLVGVVKPTSLVYVAVDGVAPRAKMNQQRSRRFKAMREAQQKAEQEEAFNADSGSRKPGENAEFPNDDSEKSAQEKWDSNCITPGTEFMDELAEHLRFYVRKKQTEDPRWQNLRVIVSGPDVPGEGEHKIMDFIRWQKNRSDYDPCQSHCLYGLDADLIMLGLVTHEPNTCLLREIVKYGQPNREMLKNPSEDSFLMFHVGLMREYLELEFVQSTKDVSLERVIDDWVLMAMLCGNDFLPPMPTLDIAEGALDMLSQIYRDILPHLDGYLTGNGRVNVGNLKVLMRKLAEKEETILKQRAQDAQEAAEKRGDVDTVADKIGAVDEDDQTERKVPEMMSAANRANFLAEDGGGLQAWREYYYKSKVGKPASEAASWLAHEYLQGLQWVCDYYYKGVTSWRWYFPAHYAPLAQDIAKLPKETDPSVQAPLGKPFKPFEQLLGVLPAASAHLVPEPLRWLMTHQASPIADLYPNSFSIDLEGKRAEWEGVILIPFMDEDRLLDALDRHWPSKGLSASDLKRNREGVPYELVNDTSGSAAPSHMKSTLPRIFSDVHHCTSIEMEQRDQPPRPLPDDARTLAASLIDGAPIGEDAIRGFPTLKTLFVEGSLESANVCVFNRSSQKQSLVISIKSKDHLPSHEGERDASDETRRETAGAGVFVQEKGQRRKQSSTTQTQVREKGKIQQLADAHLGRRMLVGWPYLREAEVSWIASLKDLTKRDVTEPNKDVELPENTRAELAEMRKSLIKRQGVDIGQPDAALGVRLSEGSVRNQDGSVQKRFSKSVNVYPLQITVPLPGSDRKESMSEEEARIEGTNLGKLPPGTQCMYVGSSYFGCPAEIEHEESSETVTVKVYPRKQTAAAFGKRVLDSNYERFTSSGAVARKLNIHPRTLGILAGSCNVLTDADERVDVGLNLRNVENNMCVPDYCRPTANDDGWQYSNSAIELFQSIQHQFKWLVNGITEQPEECSRNGLPVANILPDATSQQRSKRLQEFVLWMKRQPVGKRQLVRKNAKVASTSAIRAFAQAAPHGHSLPAVLLEGVRKELLLLPLTHGGDSVGAAITGGEFSLGERVAVAASGALVPFGDRGTIVGVHDGMACEILFDRDFPNGTTLGGRITEQRGALLPGQELLNLTRPPAFVPQEHAHPKPLVHSGASQSASESAQRDGAEAANNQREAVAVSFWEQLKGKKEQAEVASEMEQPKPSRPDPQSQQALERQNATSHQEQASNKQALETRKRPETNKELLSRRRIRPLKPFRTNVGDEDTSDSARLWWNYLSQFRAPAA